MSQHDYVIDNGSGLAVRADINSVLGAIVTDNSGTTEPPVTYPNMKWADTTSGWLKQRDTLDSFWIKCHPLNGSISVNVTAASTLDLTANSVNTDYFHIAGTTTISSVTLENGQKRLAIADSAFTLTHSSSLLVQGGVNYTTRAGDFLIFAGEAGGVVRVNIVRANSAIDGPCFSAYQSTAQSLSANTATKLLFQTEEYDTANCFASSRFTPNVPGLYGVNAVAHAASSASYLIISIYKNGSLHREFRDTNGFAGQITIDVQMNGTTDYIEAYLSLSTAQNTSALQTQTFFQASFKQGL